MASSRRSRPDDNDAVTTLAALRAAGDPAAAAVARALAADRAARAVNRVNRTIQRRATDPVVVALEAVRARRADADTHVAVVPAAEAAATTASEPVRPLPPHAVDEERKTRVIPPATFSG
jgi:hypothetical protein